MLWRLSLAAVLAAVGLGSLVAQAQFSAPVYVAAPSGGPPAGPFALKCHAFGTTDVINLATNGGDGSTSGTGANVDCTGANFFVCVTSRYTGTGTNGAPTDTSSNTYTQIGTEQATSGTGGISLWRAFSASTSNAFHWADSAGLNFASLYCAGFSDGSASAVDKTSKSATNTPGAQTPTSNNELVITGFVTADNDTGVPTVSGASGSTCGSSFSKLDSNAFSSGHFFGGGLACQIQTTATSSNPTWTTSGGGTGGSALATFQ